MLLLGFYIHALFYILLILLSVYTIYYQSRHGILSNNTLYDILLLLLSTITLLLYIVHGRCLATTLKYYQSSKEYDGGKINFKQHVSFTKCKRSSDYHRLGLSVLALLLVCRLTKLVQYYPIKAGGIFSFVKLKIFLVITCGIIISFCMMLIVGIKFYDFSVTTIAWMIVLAVVLLFIKNVLED